MQRYDMILVTRCGEGWQELQKEPEGDWVRYEDAEERIAQLTAENDALEADLRECNRAINQIAAERDYFKERYGTTLEGEKKALEAASSIAAERDLARKQVTVVQAALDSTDLARNKFLNERDEALRECERLNEDVLELRLDLRQHKEHIIEQEAELSRLKADAHNLKSPVHAICNQNLTEALAAAIEQTQTINRLKANVSDEEWGKGRHLANRSHVNGIIASRSKPPEEPK